MAIVTALDHVNIRTDRLAETVAFFEELLGLESRPDDRPAFGFPGAWLFVGSQAVLHLIEVDASMGEQLGPLDHVAFSTDDLDGLVSELDQRGLDYRLSALPMTDIRQVFFHEPNGVQIEVTGSTS